jgi:hypothetical protein
MLAKNRASWIEYGEEWSCCTERNERLENAREFFVELFEELTSFKEFDEDKVGFLISEISGFLGACNMIDQRPLTIRRATGRSFDAVPAFKKYSLAEVLA